MLRGYIPLHLYISNSCAEYLPGTFPMPSGHIRGSIIVGYVRDALWLYSRVDHGTINRNGRKLRGCCEDTSRYIYMFQIHVRNTFLAPSQCFLVIFEVLLLLVICGMRSGYIRG